MDSSGSPSHGAMSLDDLDNIDTTFLFTPSGARIQNNSAELRPPTPTAAIPADPVTSSPRGAPKKRKADQVMSLTCQGDLGNHNATLGKENDAFQNENQDHNVRFFENSKTSNFIRFSKNLSKKPNLSRI